MHPFRWRVRALALIKEQIRPRRAGAINALSHDRCWRQKGVKFGAITLAQPLRCRLMDASAGNEAVFEER
jgi:hypothetical protein